MANHIGTPLIIIPNIRQPLKNVIRKGANIVGNPSCYFKELQYAIQNNASLILVPNNSQPDKLYGLIPGSGSAEFDFIRNTTATRINEESLIETISNNTPRLDYSNGKCPSILIEQQSTNLYLNSETLVTQDNSVEQDTYTVSFYGSGTITFTGVYNGSITGTDLNTRSVLTFSSNSGVLTSTITGEVKNAQLEKGTQPTSYIPTNNSIVTRNSDNTTLTDIENLIGQNQGTIYIKFDAGDGFEINMLNFQKQVTGEIEYLITYSTTKVEHYINGVLEQTDEGNYDWSGMDYIDLGSTNGYDFFNNGIKLFWISKEILGKDFFKDAVSYYKLDETTGAVIDRNSGFNGTAENGVIRGVQGAKGNAFEFDGIDDYVALPNTYNFVQNTNVFTINMWVKILDLEARNGLMGNAGGSRQKGFFVIFDNISNITKNIRFASPKGVADQPVLNLASQNNVITDNDFHMITIVGLGNTGKIYLDGVDLPLVTNNFTSLSTGAGLDAMSIGCVRQDIVFSNAVIDEVSIFDVSKTQEEITEIYNYYTN